MKNFLEKNYRFLLGAMLVFSLVVSLLNAWWDTAIFDETAHIPAGYSYLKEGDMRLNPEHPPLIKVISGTPLLFMNLDFDTSQKFWVEDVNGQWDAGDHLMWEAGNDGDWVVFWSRFPLVLMSVFFGLFIFKWAREMAGILAGLMAATLYFFSPNILGHNHFVTTDLGIAIFITLAFYYFLRFIKKPSWKNAIIGGIFLGLLQLAKFSSVLVFPIFGLILILYPLTKKPDSKKGVWIFKAKKVGEYLGKGIFAFALSLILVWIAYWGVTYNMPEEILGKTIDFYFQPEDTDNIKNVYTNQALHALNGNSFTRPMSEYILGIAMVFKRVAGGNGAYFMGEVSSTAFPAYFPAVFLIKEPLPVIFMMLFAIGLVVFTTTTTLPAFFRKKFPEKISRLEDFFRHNVTEISLLSFIVLYSYISITGNLNIGLRHLFPIFPFAYILTAKTISQFLKKNKGSLNQAIFGSGIFALFAIFILGTISAYPYYMSYFNPVGGGPKKGFQYVTDSNSDWGQDLRRLQKFIKNYNECANLPERKKLCHSIPEEITQKENGIKKIRVDYFGGADIRYYIGERYEMWWDSKRPIEPGWYAVSTNFLMGSLYNKEKADKDSYRWIVRHGIQPVYQAGTSLLIYYITPEKAQEINSGENHSDCDCGKSLEI